MLALLLSQKDMNPGLQLYLCKVPLMDDNGFGSTSRGKKVNFCLFLIPKDIQILFCLFVFSKSGIALNPEQALYCTFLQ